MRKRLQTISSWFGGGDRLEIANTPSKTGVSKLSLTMYPGSISTDEHVPVKFLKTKKLNKIRKIH